MRPHGSFSDFVRKSSCPCAASRPRRIEVAASSVHASQRDASESRSLPHDPHHIPQLFHHLRRKQAKGTWSSTLASMPPEPAAKLTQGDEPPGSRPYLVT